MKVLTILGTRPEIIRLSLVIPLLDAQAEHVLVHTGQNFEDCLSQSFFRELGIREPDVHLGVRGARFGDQVGQIFAKTELALDKYRPDRVLVLGDTNSGLVAIVARRMGVPVYHLEAGNRCFDDRVPEEVNRRVIDHSSSVLMPYTRHARENLRREGIAGERIVVTGNPIYEVIENSSSQISASAALTRLGLTERRYFLVTLHRAENVDRAERLKLVVEALRRLRRRYDMPVVCAVHPRTRAPLQALVPAGDPELSCIEPLGFCDFVRLERSAFCILSDSGTVQEEACILRTPSVTLRDATERPETIECGANVLAGVAPEDIVRLVQLVTSRPPRWEPPPEYLAPSVASVVAHVVLGYRTPDLAELDWRARRLAGA